MHAPKNLNFVFTRFRNAIEELILKNLPLSKDVTKHDDRVASAEERDWLQQFAVLPENVFILI